jgi:2-hydroxychromene-2-carboxylate isomerase
MRSQSRWRETLERAGAAQKQRWTTGSLLSRGRAIADDMGFYTVMASRGFDRTASDACLGDRALANRIGEQSKASYASGIKTAPSFTINGTLLEKTRSWAELRPQIDASL